MRRALVCGAGGFIGSHLVKRLKQEGFWIRGVDLKQPDFSASQADEFVEGDLRDPAFCRSIADRPFDEVYQLAADMGGARYIFSGENDAEIMRNSSLINLGILDACRESGAKRVFYSSSACVYPDCRQSSESAAAAAQRPVVASDYGVVGRRVRSQTLGLLHENGSPKALAEAVTRAVDTPISRFSQALDAYADANTLLSFSESVRAAWPVCADVGAGAGIDPLEVVAL